MLKDQEFTGERIFLDGKSFRNCTFTDCTLIISGLMGFDMPDCKVENCNWIFEGAAAATINILKSLYNSGVRDLVERTCADIVGSKVEGAPPT